MDDNASATALDMPTADAPPTLPFPSARSRRKASTPAASEVAAVQLLSAAEVARRLSVGVRSLYRLAAAGHLPQPIRFSRKLVRWRTEEIERWLGLQAQAVATVAPPTPAPSATPAAPALPANTLPEPADVSRDLLALLCLSGRGLTTWEIAAGLGRKCDSPLRKLLAKLRGAGLVTLFGGFCITDRGRMLLAEANVAGDASREGGVQ